MTPEPHPTFKESGVEWLRSVPVGWNLRPLWAMFERIKDIGHPEEEMLSVFRDYGVVFKQDHANLNQTAENRNIYQLVDPGWLVTNRMKAWQGSVGISAHRGIVSGHYLCFRPRHHELPAYLNYLFRSAPYAEGYATLSRGVRIGQAEIDNDQYRLLPVLVPPLAEQRQIAEYLDTHTAKIDTLIGKQEQLIETLAERRQAVISHAVTKGLDPTVSMKDSGVAWLGKVPVSWVIVPVKWFCRLTTGMTPSTDSVENYSDDPGDYPWVRPEDLLEAGAATRASKFVSAQGWNSARIVSPGASLLCCIGATVGKVGITEQQCNTNQQITALKSSGNDRYFFYSLLASKPELVASAVGNTLPILNSERLGNVALPVPPLSEQSAIAMHLDREAAQIEALSAKAREMIDVLKERRRALISAAVTGKIDVRGLS